MELDKEQISAVMSAFGKRGRNNLREKLGEEKFLEKMSDMGKISTGKLTFEERSRRSIKAWKTRRKKLSTPLEK